MSDVLTAEEQTAFDWAVNQQFPSVAARYAKQISNALSRLMAKHKETLLEYNRLYLENSRLSDANKALENDLINATMNLEIAEKRADAAIEEVPKTCIHCAKRHGWDVCPEAHFIEDGATCLNFKWNDPTKEETT